MSQADTHRAIETVWRLEAPKLVAALIRVVRDIDLAEELAQDALVAALERWPTAGVPDNPGAWLMTTAKRRGIDLLGTASWSSASTRRWMVIRSMRPSACPTWKRSMTTSATTCSG